MTAIKKTQIVYDFATLRGKMRGEDVHPAVRRNTNYGTDADDCKLLAYYADHGPAELTHGTVFKVARNIGLIIEAPATDAQKRMPAHWNRTKHFVLSEWGQRYLADVRRKLAFTPIQSPPAPNPVCMALLSPRDVSRLHVWQAFIHLCANPSLVSSAFSEYEQSGAVALDVCPF